MEDILEHWFLESNGRIQNSKRPPLANLCALLTGDKEEEPGTLIILTLKKQHICSDE